MDELMGRRVPYSAEAEQSILGSMLIDPACIPDVVNKIRATDFYIDVNREIFETVFSMFSLGQSVDPVTLLDEMKTRGCWKENSRQYLVELMEVTPTAANVLEYCSIVRDMALLRELGASVTEISDLVYGGGVDAQQTLELAERKIYALRRENAVGGLVPLTQVLPDTLKSISAASQSDSKVPGLTTGLVDIDENLLGMQGGDFILIASRPGMGKTSIALNMAVSAAKASRKTVLQPISVPVSVRAELGQNLADFVYLNPRILQIVRHSAPEGADVERAILEDYSDALRGSRLLRRLAVSFE